MNTKEKFEEIFSNNILKIGKNSKITKKTTIVALTEKYDNKIPLHISLGYSDRKSVSKGLNRAILIDKPSGKHWDKYLLELYYPTIPKNKKQNIAISCKLDRKEYDRQYYLLNKADKQVNNRKRKLGVKDRTPTWVDIEKIKEIYNNCPKGYQVDHIIPLHGILVSGLNIHNNLQYLTETENKKKSNKFIIE